MTLASFRDFGLISNQRHSEGMMMSAPETPKGDRALQKAFSNKIVDNYFSCSESWLRSILRMCFFSLTYLEREPVFMVECPNKAVAKRLSRKTYPFREIVYWITGSIKTSDRSLFCYLESNGEWHCFDTSTSSWNKLCDLQSPPDPCDDDWGSNRPYKQWDSEIEGECEF